MHEINHLRASSPFASCCAGVMQDKGGREIVERMQAEKSSPAAKCPLHTYLLQWFSDHSRRWVDRQDASATHATSKSNQSVVAFRLRSQFLAEIL